MPKLIKLNVAVLLCLLSVCMACSELCELASLQDDVSNDFIVQVSSSSGKVEHDHAIAATLVEICRAWARSDRYRSSASALMVRLVPRAPQDLLHLLSVQRT